MISCQTIVQLMEKLAPRKLAMDWDNPGLAVGDFSKDISKILLTLTVTEEAIEYAKTNGFDMIISHHPLFFRPVKALRQDLPLGKIVYTAIKHDITIYSSHTNMDIAEGGVNDVLAKVLELTDVRVLQETHEDQLKKIVVFVPKDYQDVVRQAMGDAGAGHIGNYSHCSFNAHGFGTFKPLEGTKPFIGNQGELERVEEVRLETIVLESQLKRVINSMIKSHPYEEVAFDIYPVENTGKVLGLGRLGYLENPLTLKDFCSLVKKKLDVEHLRIVGDLDKTISKVALCGGAGSDLINRASFLGADVLLTGDIKYHEALDAKALGIALIDAGHFSTENLVLPVLETYLATEIGALGKKVDISVFKDEDPFVFI